MIVPVLLGVRRSQLRLPCSWTEEGPHGVRVKVKVKVRARARVTIRGCFVSGLCHKGLGNWGTS